MKKKLYLSVILTLTILVFALPEKMALADVGNFGGFSVTLNESMRAVKNGQTGQSCDFTVETTATGEWVLAAGTGDSPPYAWGNDVFFTVPVLIGYYSRYPLQAASFSFTCSYPAYALDTTRLPTYVKFTKEEDIPPSNQSPRIVQFNPLLGPSSLPGGFLTPPGKRYFFSITNPTTTQVSASSVETPSFTIPLSFTTQCQFKELNQVTIPYSLPMKRTGAYNLPVTIASEACAAAASPTPTGPIQCFQTCTPHPDTSANDCANAVNPTPNGRPCNACLPAPTVPITPGQPTPTPRYICQPPPTPSPTGPIQCGQACTPHPDTSTNDCANAVNPTPGGPICDQCLPNPSGSGNICQPRPTTTPGNPQCNQRCNPANNRCPTDPNGCPLCVGQVGAETCRPKAQCACDTPLDYQIGSSAANTGTIKQGDAVKFTVWGIVGTDDTEISQMTFHLQKKNDAGDWVDYVEANQPTPTPVRRTKTSSPPIVGPTGRPGKSSSKFYYTTWDFTVPTNLPAGIYRVVVPTDHKDLADFECRYKTVAAQTTSQVMSSVQPQQGFLAGLSRFFKSLFGIKDLPKTQSTTLPAEITPEELRTVAPTDQSLKLGTFDPKTALTPSPTPYLQRGCTWMEFSLN